MKIEVEIGNGRYRVLHPGIDLSIPLLFNGPQPNTYGVEGATSRPWEGSGFIGDTRRGGSCNFEKYELVPHCNGTHTECVGHITTERVSIRESLLEELIPAVVMTVQPESGLLSGETYSPGWGKEDLAITASSLSKAFSDSWKDFTGALILRTLPNPESKRFRDYMKETPAFFSMEAMRWIVNKGFRHLLTDLPSLDRLFDEGRLSAHHIFWGMGMGEQSTPAHASRYKTVTEFIYVPGQVNDGPALLNLQIAAFQSDAAPSRPVLFQLEP